MKTLIMLRDMVSANVGKRMHLEVDSEDTIYSVMARFEEMTGVPPFLQRFAFGGNSFYYDTPGTLVENKLLLVPSYSYPVDITVLLTPSGYGRLQRETLRRMGFCVDDDRLPAPSVGRRREKMYVSVMDYIRMDGGRKEMVMAVEAGDTVASVMEEARRRRRYPLAMQELRVRDAGSPPYVERIMDKLDATLADYDVKRDSQINLYMNIEFALQADREARGLNRANKEIAAPAEQQGQKLTDDQK